MRLKEITVIHKGVKQALPFHFGFNTQADFCEELGLPIQDFDKRVGGEEMRLGDIRVLADIADICGMDGIVTAQMLEDGTDLELVAREDQIAREMGVTGVPAMIFGGKLAVSGAREPQVLASVIDRVTEMSGGQSEATPDDESED